MPAAFQYDVFLSHSAQDKPRVRRLAERLKAAGVRVWLDEWVIQAGERPSPVGRERVAEGRVRDQELAIERGLEQSRVLLLCLSPAALASGWVALERSTAVHRDPANAGRRFIPLLLGDCALPETLRHYKVVDFREESEAAFAEVPATGQAETAAVKRHVGFPHGNRRASKRRRARQSNATTRRLAVMSLVIRGIEADFGSEHADTFRRDPHPDLRADYVLANGSMSSNQSGEASFESAFWIRTSSLSQQATT